MLPAPAGDEARRAERLPAVSPCGPTDVPVGRVPAAPDQVVADRRLYWGRRVSGVRPRRDSAAWRLGRLRAYVVLARPRQWVKNLLVIAAPAAGGVLVDGDVPVHVALTFAALCFLSGGTYAVNDYRDMLEDRDHPRKRHRPVAAGDIAPSDALRAAAALMLAGLLLCLAVSPWVLVVGAGYLAVTVTYSVLWRRIAFFDVGAIATGFVLRAVAGGLAAPVPLSRSFLLVVTFGAVFLASGKRHAELVRRRLAGPPSRRVLALYTVKHLRSVLGVSATLAFAAYCIWAFHGSAHGTPWRALTVVPFAAGLARYGALLGRGAGEAPEELLMKDHVLQLVALTWAAIFAASVYGAS